MITTRFELVILCILSLLITFKHALGSSSNNKDLDDNTNLCLNDCSGHGRCTGQQCACAPGYHGEDCSVTFSSTSAIDAPTIFAPLSVGNAILTLQNFTKYAKANPKSLIGISSSACHRCAVYEQAYSDALELLKLSNNAISFARINAATEHELAADLDVSSLPSLIFIRTRRKRIEYTGQHTAQAIALFVRKQLSPAVTTIKAFQTDDSIEQNDSRMKQTGNNADTELERLINQHRSVTLRELQQDIVIAIAIFPNSFEAFEDEVDDVKEAAIALRGISRVYFVQTTTIPTGWIDSMPMAIETKRPTLVLLTLEWRGSEDINTKRDVSTGSIISLNTGSILNMIGAALRTCGESSRSSLNTCETTGKFIPELGGRVHRLLLDIEVSDGQSLAAWVSQRSVPLVDVLHSQNFATYERLNIPMLILFCSRQEMHGKNGKGFALSELGQAFRESAGQFQGLISFVLADKDVHRERAKGLGVDFDRHISKTSVQSPDDEEQEQEQQDGHVLAINSPDGLLSPPLYLDRTTESLIEQIRKFCDAYLGGTLASGKKSGIISSDNIQLENDNKKFLKHQETEESGLNGQVKGVREEFNTYDSDAIRPIKGFEFQSVIWDSPDMHSVDMVILFHRQGHAVSMQFAPFIKKVARQFSELGIETVRFYRMNLAVEIPPAQLNIGQVPSLVLLPAGQRSPPMVFFSGVAKVLPIMLWIEENVNVRFTLPNLPQFTDHQRELYKEQVATRERSRRSKQNGDVSKEDSGLSSQVTMEPPRDSTTNTKTISRLGGDMGGRTTKFSSRSTVKITKSSKSYESRSHVSAHVSNGKLHMTSKSIEWKKSQTSTRTTTASFSTSTSGDRAGGRYSRELDEL